MRVKPHTSSGYVLVLADHRDDTFVDARPAGTPGYSQIDVVRCGRRMRREIVPTLRAPARILTIARGERL